MGSYFLSALNVALFIASLTFARNIQNLRYYIFHLQNRLQLYGHGEDCQYYTAFFLCGYNILACLWRFLKIHHN